MNRNVLRTKDDSDDSENETFEIMINKKFRKYIRMKDLCKVKKLFTKNNELTCGHFMCKNKQARILKDCNNNIYFENEMNEDDNSSSENSSIKMELSDSSSPDDIDIRLRKEYGEPFEWNPVWNDIFISLESMKLNNENHLYLEYFTFFLKLHIEHRIELEMPCYRALLYCIEPEMIQNLFDMNLINIEDSDHIGCWIQNDLFSGIEILADDINLANKHAPKLLNSLAVLIYKIKVHQAEEIVTLLNDYLTVFINREDKDSNRKNSNVNSSLIKATRNFLTACALNGYFNCKESFNSFLMNTNTDLEDFTDSDLNSDDEDDENNIIFNVIHQGHQLHINHQPAAAAAVVAAPPPVVAAQIANYNNNNNNQTPNLKTTADRLNINKNELTKLIFPLSLQNMCRMVIKKCLKPYSIKGVNKLNILPNTMKKFVLFQNEIDDIIS